MNEEKAVPCKRCGSYPTIVKINDMYYAQCFGHFDKKTSVLNKKTNEMETRLIPVKCTRWGPYNFLGFTRKAALRNWNDANSKTITEEED